MNTEREELIVKKLSGQFGSLDVANAVRRQRRIWIAVPVDEIRSVLEYAVQSMDFSILCAITGLDEGANIGLIYHVADNNGIVLNLKTAIPKDRPDMDTVTGIFASAEIYEREIADLLGVKVRGLPEGKRYPLPDDWPQGQYPLRKDWDPGILEKERGS